MKTALIKERLHHYIETAGEEKLKAIYVMVENEIKGATNMWEDKNFVSELERREHAYKSNTAKMLSLGDSIKRAKRAVKKVKTSR